MLQSGVLAVGAYLVIEQQATAGIIIAGSILSARALAPVELAIANWRGFVGARQSWKRLTDCSAALPDAGRRRWRCRRRAPALSVEGVERRAAGRPEASSCRTSAFSLQGRQRPRHHRAERLGQDLRWRGCWSASGRRCAARSASTAPRSINGRRKRSAGTSAICRRTSSCSPARWRRTSRRFEPSRRTPRRSSRRPRPPACTT